MATLLLLRLGSGHTQTSRGFVARPEFAVWVWIYAVYVGTAVAVGLASFPAFWILTRSTGWRAAALAVATWLVVGVLVLRFGPSAVEGLPLWLGVVRSNAANVIAGVFIAPSFAGLLLVQTRLSALAKDTVSAANEGKAGGLIIELAWLRTAMLRFLATFATAITVGLLALGALRHALLASGVPAKQLPRCGFSPLAACSPL